MEKIPNLLLKSTSPYLLQHAYNPVEWREWNDATLAKAMDEQKLMIVSIGYSACHWCHVMEHESFENYEVAEVMNHHFINIKVDREERPDIDQIYMYAIQLMRGTGGWPLNCVCLPNGKPIYGGTYFRKEDWIQILLQLAKLWKENPNEAIQYADKLSEGISEIETIIPKSENVIFDLQKIEAIVAPWKQNFDMNHGGYLRAPKFPMPNNWQFLLQYAAVSDDITVHHATLFCLQKMALGGIYDHLEGGFARYSVDDKWHIPHFEKMLYDNAQLVSVYAQAYQYCKLPLFEQVIHATIQWLKSDMLHPDGVFYSALDADSEGVEGKFYTWTADEISQHLSTEEAQLFNAFYGVTEAGNWKEEHTNVLMAQHDVESFAEINGFETDYCIQILNNAKTKLKAVRAQRIRPGLDHKIIISWNGLMIKGLCDAYKALGNEDHLQMALKAMKALLSDSHPTLHRIYQKPEIPAFLDDYACMIEALIALYECTFDEEWLYKALKYTEEVILNFSNDENSLFYYTSKNSEALIARKCEITDNVIPSSNSIMAHQLQKLSLYFSRPDFEKRYQKMLQNTAHLYQSYGSAYSNWVSLALQEVKGCYEIALSGKISTAVQKEMFRDYIPFKIYLGNTPSSLPLLKDKDSLETKIYICKNKTCSLPFSHWEEAFQFIHNGS